MTDRLRIAATWLALAASLAAGLAFLGVRIVEPSDGARIAFYGDAWSSAGVAIAPIDEPAPGLEPGDVIQAVDGRSMDTWVRAATDGGVERPGEGVAIPYRLTRDGVETETTVTWSPPALGAALSAGWSVLVFSVALALIAAFVFARRPHEPAATALMLAACGAAGSSLPWFVGVTISDVVEGAPFVLHSLITGPLYMVLWPAGIHLALTFPAPLPVVRAHRAVLPLVYAVALGSYAIATVAAAFAAPSAVVWVGTWPLIQVAVVVPCMVAATVLLAWQWLRTTDPAVRTRIRWVMLGGTVSVIAGLALFMAPELVVKRTLLPDAAIGLIALPLPLGIAAGILRDRLFDIDVAVNRTLVYGGLTAGVLATYAAVASLITAVLGGDRGFGASLLATGTAALVALPLRDGLQRAVNRLMYGQRDEPWQVMRRLGLRLEWAADPDRAFPAIAETVAEALRLPYVGVEVSDGVGRPTMVAEHGAPGGDVEALPLVHGAEPVGRLVLGIRSGERGFRDDELDLLGDLARQAGAAIHALRLRDDLARSREGLVVAREEERRRLRRDLHDGLGPTLAAIGMRAEATAAVMDADSAAARRQLDALGVDLDAALADVRRLVDGLRPPALDELGLVGALGQQAARLDGRSGGDDQGVAIQVECEPRPLPELPAAVEVAAYRIAVEAMTNAVRHAEAHACRVRLVAGSQLTIEVVDDGLGIGAAQAAGTGIESMRERASELGGDVTVEPRQEGGTTVTARLPIWPTLPMTGSTA